MPGRTSDVSVSTFKPLSLNEILMVPLAKRKQEDAFMAANDKLGALEASAVAEDQEQASSIVSGFKNKSDELADKVMSSGISGSDFNKLRSLRKEINQEYSTGFLGRAKANKESISKYIINSTKKDNRSGWGSAEAKQHAMSYASGFKTQNEDGTFNSFMGKELTEKIDEDKIIKEAVDSVRGSLSQKTIGILNLGGLDGIHEALRTQDVDKKDWNAIMEALIYKSRTNPQLLKSLQQQAEFSGEKEDPLDMGSFEDVPNKNKPGESIKRFKPGKGRYGQKMFGAARAASSPISKVGYEILKDGAATNMVKNGANVQSALDAMHYSDGTIEQVKAPRQSKLRENLKTYKKSALNLKKGADKYKSNLVAEKIKNNPALTEEAAEQEALQDTDYLRQMKEYVESSGRASNAQSRLDGMYKVVKKEMSEEERKVLEIADLIEKEGDVFKALASVGGKVVRDDSWAGQTMGTSDETHKSKVGAELFRIMGAGTFDMSDLLQDTLSLSGGMFTEGLAPEGHPYMRRIMDAQSVMDDKSTKYLQADAKADSYEVYEASNTGKYSLAYAEWASNASKKFQAKGKTIAFGRGPLTEDYLLEQTGGVNKDKAKKGSVAEGFTYVVSGTDGHDFNGHHFNNVKVTNNYTKETINLPVVDGANRIALSSLAGQLSKGTGNQPYKGNLLNAKIKYMPFVKRAGIKMQDQGVMYIPGEGEPAEGSIHSNTKNYKIEYTRQESKTDGKVYFLASVVSGNGKKRVLLNNGSPMYGEDEMVLAIDKAMKGISNASNNRKK